MAEAAVSFVVEKLRDLLIQEAIFLYGVRDQVEWVESELRRMQCFLKDADAKRRKGDERVKNWVREVTDVAYQAEDAIDNFILQVEPRQRQKGLVGFIWRYATIPSMLIARHKVGKEIERIKIKIRDISESRVTYGIANLGEIGEDQERHESVEARRRVSPNLNDDTDAIVGFDVHSKMIVSQLLDPKTKRRCIISIIGMGGLGKTSLAKKIFNSREIMKSFPTRIWITVSQDYQMCELLKSIARKAMGTSTDELDKMKEEEVKEKLHEFLKEEIYLIVMDDIWRTNVWIKINEALPDVKNGSRILITSRFVEVAKSADPGIPPLMLPLLNDDESWELFTKKAFLASSCPEELKLLARQMVNKCRGLPLALVVLGGILSRKLATPLVWLKVSESMDWESTEDGKDCMNILALSYNNLPNLHLKSCFLYMGSFAEDSEIRASRLIRLWIAEGFIPQRERETMEDTASRYLEELVQRSLIQVVKRRMYDGGISRCRIHDLMREVCLVEAKHDGFLSYISSSSSSNDSNVSNSRRLVLQGFTDANYSRYLTPNLRALFARFRLDRWSRISFHGLKLLRVLVMCEMATSHKLPKEIGSMIHLRYLEVGHHKLNKISPFIGRFRELQTLDITLNETSCKLPKELVELLNVRHLFLPYSLQCCPPIGTSTKLQTLKNVRCNETWIKENLPRLTNLRRLFMICEGDANALSAALGKLCLLASLELTTDKLSAKDILTALAQNHHLHKLKLTGKILEQRLPTSSVFPPNLAKLRLSWSKLGQDPIPMLEKLPNLMSLELSMDAYQGENIVCTTGGFPRLQVFEIEYLYVKHWIVEVGSLLNLSTLKILWCQSLAMLPDGLQHISSLKELVVYDERKEFRDMLQENVGEDWYKIKHVPSLVIQGRIYGAYGRAAHKQS